MRSHRTALVLLALLTIVGGALRIGAAASPTHYQSNDEKAYARLAHAIAEHGSYAPSRMDDPVRWGPGAPVAFAVAQRAFGGATEDDRDVPAAYAFQAAFGILLIPATFALGLALAGQLAGLLAAAAVAFYPPLIGATRDLLSEPLGALLLTLALLALVLTLRRPSWWGAAGTGALLGLTVLTRVDLLAVPAIIAAILAVALWRGRGRRTAITGVAALIAGCLVVLAPWSAYASRERGEFVPVTSGGATNLFIGTFVPGGGRLYGVKEHYADRVRERHPSYADRAYASIPQRFVLEVVEAEHPDLAPEAALRAAALDNVREYVIGDPLGFGAMAAEKAWRLWGWPTRGSGRKRQAWVRALHIPLVVLATVGLVVGLIVRRGRDAGLWAIAAVLAYVTITNAVLVAEARHNLPVMPVLLAAGAAGLGLALAARRAAEPTTVPEET